MVEKSDDGNDGGVIDLDNDPDIIRGTSNGGAGGDGSIDPASATVASSGSGSSGTGKRRGRKPGVKNAPKKANIDLSGIEQILFSAHAMLSAWVSVPELAIAPEEAEKLAKTSAAVAKHYTDLAVSEKRLAWINLSLCLGQIYGPRVIAISLNRKTKRASRDTPTQHQQASNKPQENARQESVVIFPPGRFAQSEERGM